MDEGVRIFQNFEETLKEHARGIFAMNDATAKEIMQLTCNDFYQAINSKIAAINFLKECSLEIKE